MTAAHAASTQCVREKKKVLGHLCLVINWRSPRSTRDALALGDAAQAAPQIPRSFDPAEMPAIAPRLNDIGCQNSGVLTQKIRAGRG